nr:type II toxin-antitoxin system VapC family toxin [uncultured Rhodopila sp.]
MPRKAFGTVNEVEAPASVLLDTCAVIWMVNTTELPARVTDLIAHASQAGGVYISTASAREIGLLSRPGRRPMPSFHPDPKTWFARVLALPGIKEALITPGIAIDSSHLPGDLPPDPADRLIIATARHLGMPIVTGDRKIIAYAAAGHVSVIPC